LAGFIRNCGLIKRKHAHEIPSAYRLYRKRSKASRPGESAAVQFRQDFAVADITPIEFVGVWDTVGALGIPVPFWGTLNSKSFLFHDTEPSKIVQHARHAVSIDENREDFRPELWDDKPGLDIEQVWFAGTHSDVGGGYKQSGLSDWASHWMLNEALGFGLKFESHFVDSLVPNAADRQHNERKGMYRLRGEVIRTVSGALHQSVKDRWDANAHGYRKKSKAMKALLHSVDSDWSKVKVVS
jgi:uncharacterized protein (DUF2235 family)